MRLESKLLDAYRSKWLGNLKRLYASVRMREVMPILLLHCFLEVGCRETDSTGRYPIVAAISGSSMEPTLLGAQRLARCQNCETTLCFSDEPALEDYPTPCPRCGNPVSWEGFIAEQSVEITPVDWSKSHALFRILPNYKSVALSK